jgi:hypothetical protein
VPKSVGVFVLVGVGLADGFVVVGVGEVVVLVDVGVVVWSLAVGVAVSLFSVTSGVGVSVFVFSVGLLFHVVATRATAINRAANPTIIIIFGFVISSTPTIMSSA